ncbi:MAG: hypothetical protein LBU65_06900 [Planctomycetaceae bacterium]|jgi:Ca2+-binding EF-hand superfamily protein|nr:hypothetical protein [Planctomycetaceae bacterium]
MRTRFFVLPLFLFFVAFTAALFAQFPPQRSERGGDRGGERRSGDSGGGFRGGPGFGGMAGRPGFGGMPGGGPGFGGMPGGGPGFGGMSGGGPGFGGMPGGQPRGADNNDRTLSMLRSMDTNGDGRIDMNEIPEYRRPFVSMMLTRLGVDPNKTIRLSDLERKIRSGSTSGGTATANVADPLVPPFGESAAASTPVLGFGQREPETKTVSVRRVQEQPAQSSTDKIQQAARELMNKYDKNKNGYLDKDKSEWSKTLPFDANAADKNKDGRISMSEMIAALGGKIDVASGYVAAEFHHSEPYDHLPVGTPDWFLRMDKNQDAQITMYEYAEGKAWNDEMAKEFAYVDRNNDGIVTIDECFATLKEYDEAKAKKEDEERRKQERMNAITGKNNVPPPRTDEKSQEQPALANGAPPAQPDGSQPSPPSSQPSSAPPTPPQNAPYSSGTPNSPRGNSVQRNERSGIERGGNDRSGNDRNRPPQRR